MSSQRETNAAHIMKLAEKDLIIAQRDLIIAQRGVETAQRGVEIARLTLENEQLRDIYGKIKELYTDIDREFVKTMKSEIRQNNKFHTRITFLNKCVDEGNYEALPHYLMPLASFTKEICLPRIEEILTSVNTEEA